MKLRAAVAARRSTDLFIIARTDARAVHGLDEALRRGEVYLNAGADGLFIEAPQSVEELARVGQSFQGVPQLANMLGGRRPPHAHPAAGRAGAARLCHGRVPHLAHFRRGACDGKDARRAAGSRLASAEQTLSFEQFKDITGLAQWGEIEQRFDGDAVMMFGEIACRSEAVTQPRVPGAVQHEQRKSDHRSGTRCMAAGWRGGKLRGGQA